MMRGRMMRGRPGNWRVLTLGAVLTAGGAASIAVAFTAGQTATGAATQIPASVQTSVPTLTSVPAARGLRASEPIRLEIPSLDVNAPVMRLGREADGTIQVPPLNNHNLTSWFDRSVTPGQDGTAIILGHVDNFTGPSVFFSVKTLRPGDLIKVVRADGRTATFSVDGVQKVAKAIFPTAIVYGNTRYPELRLITCGGPFDTTTRQYLDNIVVYSHLVKGSG
jgi:sortase (surface protein transpeptidase)